MLPTMEIISETLLLVQLRTSYKNPLVFSCCCCALPDDIIDLSVLYRIFVIIETTERSTIVLCLTAFMKVWIGTVIWVIFCAAPFLTLLFRQILLSFLCKLFRQCGRA